MLLSRTTASVVVGVPPIMYDHPVRNDNFPSLRVTDLSSSTFGKVLEELNQSASTFRDNKKIVKAHRVTVVKRRRPYQKIKSANSETFEVNKYIRFSQMHFSYAKFTGQGGGADGGCAAGGAPLAGPFQRQKHLRCSQGDQARFAD